MESNKERVLAYSMAKVLEQDDLAKVSGGGWHWTYNLTNAVSKIGGQGNTGHMDACIDW